MLILAGITIVYVLGDNGVFSKAQEAKDTYEIEKLRERIENIKAGWLTQKLAYHNVIEDDFWNELAKEGIIDSKEENVDGPDEDGIYIVTTNDSYEVEVILNGNGTITIGEINKIGDSTENRGISVVPNNRTMAINDTIQLTVKIKPSTEEVQGITWESSNESIATVDNNGLVTAKGVGEATITAKTTDESSKTATCKITVLTSLEIDRGRTGNVDILFVDKSNKVLEASQVPTPKLGERMTAIKWNEEANDGAGDWEEVTNPETDKSWYSYTEGKKQWANAKVTVDGVESYFVWVPRYAYKIEYLAEDNKTVIGYSDYRGIVDLNGTVQEGTTKEGAVKVGDNYVLHPTFTTNEANGGWDKDIEGIWVAKFEASRIGTTNKFKVVPGESTWRRETISNFYDYCKQYDESQNSHMIKNSEWGATTYLAQSKYGKKSKVQKNGTRYAGGGKENAYVTNITQSTTGNVYGIYDMSGNSQEFIAAYLEGGYITAYGKSLAEAEAKYKTIYLQEDYNANKGRYGDAIYETSSSGDVLGDSWNENTSYFLDANHAFFQRGGGDSTSAVYCGIFGFGPTNGESSNNGAARVVLIL